MSRAYVVNAGLEPVEFRALFPFWEDHPDVAKINLEVRMTSLKFVFRLTMCDKKDVELSIAVKGSLFWIILGRKSGW